MKAIINTPRLILLALAMMNLSTTCFSQKSEINDVPNKKVKWFTDSRFGMFIHWTPVGILDQEIGWTWGNGISKETYIQTCKEFNPTKFDAESVVRLAKNAGMKYIVFVPKHHDGFCLWDTKATDFNIMNSVYAKDVCKMLSEACEKYGIAFCTYYSIADLNENAWPHMYGVEAQNIPLVKGGMDLYFEFVKKQCAELVMQYKTRNFWFDGFWHPEWYNNPRYREELYSFIKSLNADVIMARLQMPFKPEGGWWDDGWDFQKNIGDYHSREDHGGKDWHKLYYKGPWEFCSSISYPYYSYNSKLKYKTAQECVQTLVEIAGRNGNYLLDISPKPDGSIEGAQINLLSEIGDWVKAYGESIYQTEGGPYLPVGGKFASTRKGNKIYLHLLNGQKTITLPNIGQKVISAKILPTSAPIKIVKLPGKYILDIPDNYLNSVDIIVVLTIKGRASKISLTAPGF